MANLVEQLMADTGRMRTIEEMHGRGESISAIARAVGRHRHVVTAVLAETGRPASSRNGVRERMLEFIRRSPGMPKKDIAQRFGIHPNTVAEYLRGAPEAALVVQGRDGEPLQRYSDADIARALNEAWDALDEDGRARGMSRDHYDRTARRLEAADGVRRPSSALLTIRRYGSWTEACQSVGIRPGRSPVSPVPRRYQRDDVLEWVVRYIRETGGTTIAGYSRWAAANGGPSAATVRNRYGRWSDVRRDALPLTVGVGADA
jgi:transposase